MELLIRFDSSATVYHKGHRDRPRSLLWSVGKYDTHTHIVCMYIKRSQTSPLVHILSISLTPLFLSLLRFFLSALSDGRICQFV